MDGNTLVDAVPAVQAGDPLDASLRCGRSASSALLCIGCFVAASAGASSALCDKCALEQGRKRKRPDEDEIILQDDEEACFVDAFDSLDLILSYLETVDIISLADASNSMRLAVGAALRRLDLAVISLGACRLLRLCQTFSRLCDVRLPLGATLDLTPIGSLTGLRTLLLDGRAWRRWGATHTPNATPTTAAAPPTVEMRSSLEFVQRLAGSLESLTVFGPGAEAAAAISVRPLLTLTGLTMLDLSLALSTTDTDGDGRCTAGELSGLPRLERLALCSLSRPRLPLSFSASTALRSLACRGADVAGALSLPRLAELSIDARPPPQFEFEGWPLLSSLRCQAPAEDDWESPARGRLLPQPYVAALRRLEIDNFVWQHGSRLRYLRELRHLASLSVSVAHVHEPGPDVEFDFAHELLPAKTWLPLLAAPPSLTELSLRCFPMVVDLGAALSPLAHVLRRLELNGCIPQDQNEFYPPSIDSSFLTQLTALQELSVESWWNHSAIRLRLANVDLAVPSLTRLTKLRLQEVPVSVSQFNALCGNLGELRHLQIEYPSGRRVPPFDEHCTSNVSALRNLAFVAFHYCALADSFLSALLVAASYLKTLRVFHCTAFTAQGALGAQLSAGRRAMRIECAQSDPRMKDIAGLFASLPWVSVFPVSFAEIYPTQL